MSYLMLDIAGTKLAAEDKEILEHPAVQGMILFARNCEAPQQIIELNQSIRKINPDCLIAVDQEGGRVRRLRDGYSELPSASACHSRADSKQQALRNANALGELMALEVIASGFDISFAPVLDLDMGVSEVIGDRAFHQDPTLASELANAYRFGMKKVGMAATGKHFPGHGSIAPDSHIAIPVDERGLAEIEEADLVPFQHLIRFGLEGIMPAHVIYSQFDQSPACFSRFWLQEVLRGTLAFDGCIFSDDLTMEGASVMGDMVARTQASFEAGCDIALVCNDREASVSVLDGIQWKTNKDALQRVRRMRYQGQPLNFTQLNQLDNWTKAKTLIDSMLA
jgi:beta-N-acetylhexosaminidase